MEVEEDLLELFLQRRNARGAVHAHWRLYKDVASLWIRRAPAARNESPHASRALLGDVRDDLKHAARLFSRQPATLLFTIAGLSLGLGIATSIFSLMNTALRGEGLVDSDRVPGVLRTTDRSVATTWTSGEFLRLRDGATRMQVEAVRADDATARIGSTEDVAPPAAIAFVSGGFFAATGGRVSLGRPLVPSDEQHVGPPPVVVSFVFWTSRLNRDAAAVGRTIAIGRTAATIVGVAERGFTAPNNRLLWMPLTAFSPVYSGAPATRTANLEVQVFGRLLPGVPLAEAEAQLGVVAGSLSSPGDSVVRARLDPGAGLGRASSADAWAMAFFVLAVIGLVLLLACANVATVLISAAITRDREMGVRAALGASRRRLVRQLVTESLALGAIAAALGLLFAYWAIPVAARLIEAPAGADLAPDLIVYLFLGIVTLLTGVGAGLAPAWYSRGTDLVTPLKGERAREGRVAPRRLRFLLVTTQAAASVMLIVLSTLFVRATVRAAAIDVGFVADELYAASSGPGPASGNDTREFHARAIAELQSIPGIRAVSLADLSPFGGMTQTAITREDPRRVIHFIGTDAGYFETMGLRVLAGRTYTREEVAAHAPVALVSESLARAYWQGKSPLGDMLPPAIPVSTTPRPVVVGVVADAITANVYEGNRFAFYVPVSRADSGFSELLIRAEPGAIDQVSRRLRSIDPRVDVNIASVAARLQQEAAQPRMLAALSGMVGAFAVALCAIGLYGLTASVVGQRAREMGVRVALGAAPRDLLRLLMWDSLRPVLLGLAVGTAAALLAGRVVVAAMFFGVSPQDPIAFGGAAAILVVASTVAVLAPTRRAARLDPALVLRRS